MTKAEDAMRRARITRIVVETPPISIAFHGKPGVSHTVGEELAARRGS
jgi:hypothetical protein